VRNLSQQLLPHTRLPKAQQRLEGVDRTVVVLQPAYLPWLGFFDQILRADVLVFYDDVQFDKGGWRNRNRIKSPNGPHWLTVPIRHAGCQSILEVEIANQIPWARKHVKTMRQFYAKAPYLKCYLPELEELLQRRWDRIVDLNIAVIEMMCVWLGLGRQTFRASELRIEGERSQRLLNFCLRFGANRYLSGAAAKNFLDVDLFTLRNIDVQWQGYKHPAYPQQHGEFVPCLSALDLLLNCGDESRAILAGR
jgi:hypothetical protein